MAGRESTTASTFSDTYDNIWLSAVTQACTTSALSNCSSALIGVWGAEWRVSDVGYMLEELLDAVDMAGRRMNNKCGSVVMYGKLSQLSIRYSHATHICNTCNKTLEESQ